MAIKYWCPIRASNSFQHNTFKYLMNYDHFKFMELRLGINTDFLDSQAISFTYS